MNEQQCQPEVQALSAHKMPISRIGIDAPAVLQAAWLSFLEWWTSFMNGKRHFVLLFTLLSTGRQDAFAATPSRYEEVKDWPNLPPDGAEIFSCRDLWPGLVIAWAGTRRPYGLTRGKSRESPTNPWVPGVCRLCFPLFSTGSLGSFCNTHYFRQLFPVKCRPRGCFCRLRIRSFRSRPHYPWVDWRWRVGMGLIFTWRGGFESSFMIADRGFGARPFAGRC